MNYLKEIKDSVKGSNLTMDEKIELLLLCSQMTDTEHKTLVELFNQDISWVEKFYKNYQNKVVAIINNDRNKVNEIINTEIDILSGVPNNV